MSGQKSSSINDSGIERMEIYWIENRLFMIMETSEEFSFNQKTSRDRSNIKVHEWEKLIWTYQQQIPGSKPGEKWRLMDRIFKLENKDDES